MKFIGRMRGLKLLRLYSRTSKRAFSTENGFKIKPTPTRVTAPASRLPWFDNFGRTVPETVADEAAQDDFSTKYGEFVMRARMCVKEVMYSDTPGTALPTASIMAENLKIRLNIPEQRGHSPSP
jgi:hypothetical protein